MKNIFLIPLLLLGIANARPQESAVNEDFETLTDGVEQLGKDISNVVNSKTGALVFIGGNAFNYTVDVAETVSSKLGQAGTFINGITLEGLENGTTFANRMFFNLFEPFKMGNKEGKFKKIFEEIDTSGDCEVSIDELMNFLDPNQNEKLADLLMELDTTEINDFADKMVIFFDMRIWNDGKFTFEEFFKVMKDDKDVKKLILKISDV